MFEISQLSAESHPIDVARLLEDMFILSDHHLVKVLPKIVCGQMQ